jgi:hypothetical protein
LALDLAAQITWISVLPIVSAARIATALLGARPLVAT